MSEDVVKTAVRVPMPSLKGLSLTEVVKKLVPVLGDPEDVDEWEGEVEWVEWDLYDVHKSKEGMWFLDCLTEQVAPPYEHAGLRMTFEELKDLATPVIMAFGASLMDCQVVAYSWYSGVDEPL